MIRYDETRRTQQSVLELPETDVSIQFLAGHFIGEGCIGASIQKNVSLSCGVPSTHVVVAVASVDWGEVEMYKDYFGVGNLGTYDNSQSQFGYEKSTINKWVVSTQLDARNVLEQLQPYITIGPKQKQIPLALEYLSLHTRSGDTMPQDMAERKLELVKEIQSLTYGGQSGGD